MRNSFLTTIKNIIGKIFVLSLFVSGLVLPFFMQACCATDNNGDWFTGMGTPSGLYPEDEGRLTELQKEARTYRQQGMEYQKVGDLDRAMSYYQKAVEIDSGYAIAYNDLGIIYEAKNMPERAEESYLKAVQINPNFFSAYSNLALFYENKRNLKKAAEYWQKRIEYGPRDDPWTEKAERRLNDIKLVIGEKDIDMAEDNLIGLMNEVVVEKKTLRKDDGALAQKHLEKARLAYKKGNNTVAIKEAADARSLDPSNAEIDEFLEKVQTRMLSQ